MTSPLRPLVRELLALVAVSTITSIAVANPARLPRGAPISDRSEKARLATTQFWQAFHDGAYEQADQVIKDLTVAWRDDAADPVVARLLGAAHGWKFMERGRANKTAKDVVNDGILCIDLMEKAGTLDPHHRVIPAILEPARAAKAIMTDNKTLLEETLERLRGNTRRDPAMHGFVQGWVFTALLDPGDCRYQEGVDALFATLDHCANFRVPRRYPTTGPLINSWLAFRARRHDCACYNNDVAPHNLEGTFLGLGDALAKQGKITEARRAYLSVKRCPDYSCWKYQDVLETRLANLDSLCVQFRAQTGRLDVEEPAMFFLSQYACSACHAN